MNDTSILHGPFWRVTIGQVGAAALILFGFFVGFGRLSEKFDTVSTAVVENRASIVKMDQQGTTASQRKIDIELVTLNGHEQRIAKIEDAIADIRVMKEQTARIGEDVKEIKNESKTRSKEAKPQ